MQLFSWKNEKKFLPDVDTTTAEYVEDEAEEGKENVRCNLQLSKTVSLGWLHN